MLKNIDHNKDNQKFLQHNMKKSQIPNQEKIQRKLNENKKNQNIIGIAKEPEKMEIDDGKQNDMEISLDGKKTADQTKSGLNSKELSKAGKEDFLQKHQRKLNEILISNYGSDIYDFSIEVENKNYSPDPLAKHKIDKDIRTKMVDWILEVLSAYNSEIFTFNLSVQIMDMYLSKCKTVLSNSDVHLIGIVSMFIASKMEDIYPIRMSHIRTKISHGKFSESEIIKKERAILQTLEYDVIVSSNSDFIKTFVYDFIHNNRVQIDKLEMWHHIDAFENTTIFLSKLIQHDVEFNKYKESLKSVSCIVAAFDILRSNSNNFEKESEDFMRQWVNEINFFVLNLDSLYYQ